MSAPTRDEVLAVAKALDAQAESHARQAELCEVAEIADWAADSRKEERLFRHCAEILRCNA